MNVIVIEKEGALYEKNVTMDKLYTACGYRSNKNFEKLYEWLVDDQVYELYGKRTGKFENIYELPEVTETFYGALCVVKQDGHISLDEWNMFAQDYQSENFHDDGHCDSVYSDEDVDKKEYTVEGYLKDGFVVDNDELEYEEYEPEA
jgi:hypothetical protein